MPKPLLSIGIIFRDDIRCIERCLEALRPLREAIPCELVMADTGSVDGSRKIAEKYADILFDFPWINDFAAARNAVIDRCSGEWYLSVDTDEYLDGDFSDLVTVLKRRGEPLDLYLVNIRNYPDYEMEEPYTAFLAMRLFRRTVGIRYEGAIHERLTGEREGSIACPLPRVVFKHDGYAGADKEAGRAKRERNMALLREELKRKPDDLLRWLQTIESGLDEEDYPELIRRAVALVKEKADEWERYGPPIFRYAAIAAAVGKIPDFRSWLEQAETWFPDSYFTRIDVNYYATVRAWQDKEYEECVRRGELLRAAYADFRAGRGDVNCAAVNPLTSGAPYFEALTGILLAASCQELGRGEQAVPILLELDYGSLDEDQAENAVRTLCAIHSQSGADTAALVKVMWEGLCAPVPSERRGAARRAAFLRTAAVTFQAGYRKSEREREDFHRHAYTAFLPLAGMCVIGDAAVIMGSADADEIERLLRTVQRWDQLPAAALEHALSEGVVFPLADKPLSLEEMDVLASRMVYDGFLDERVIQMAEHLPEDWQGLIWVRELALAAVQSCDWEQAGQGMDLCRAFARIEGAVLPRYYGETLLCEENIHVLPPMHRFGWYCAQAFKAMDSGSHTEYARLLRAGLTSCPSMRAMVEFLMRELERTMRLQAPPELLSLAEQVRTLLAAYDPDDPAVKALKASPAYRKVAHLIEGKGGNGHSAGIKRKEMNIQEFLRFLSSYAQMSKMLKTYDYQEILKQASALAKMAPADLEQYPMGGYSKGMTSGAYRFVLKDLLEHIEEYDWLYSRFEDDISREVFTYLIRYRLFPANSYLVAAYDSEHPHYYDKTIVKCNEDEVFVDCGAYNGNSTEKFIKYYGTYKHIYAYEPSAENIQACRNNLKKYHNVTVRKCGVGEKRAFLSLDSSGASSTFMRERKAAAGDGIQIISLDEDISERITYCKMDIEGFEIPALLGAKQHIHDDFPKLAISVYHIVTDIWEIPRLIDSFHPGYRFFIRHYDPKHNWETVIYAIPPEKE